MPFDAFGLAHCVASHVRKPLLADTHLLVPPQVEPDEPHIAAGRAAVRAARQAADAIGLKSPFL